MKEIWKDIVGYEGLYQVSNKARVRSLDREVTTKNGHTQTYHGSIKKQGITTTGYLRVNLHKQNKLKTHKIHVLMAEAFLNHKRDGFKLVVDHIDNNPLNNNLDNLQIITNRENSSKDKKGGSSEYVGVSFNNGKWVSSIQIKSKDIYLGRYNKELDAAKAYKTAVDNEGLFKGNPTDFRNEIKEMI